MTSELLRSSELDRLMGADRLARPLRPLGDGSAGRRDARPSWDPWYSLPLTLRRQLLAFMAPADGGGLQPDEVADLIGAETIDDALEAWARACQLARRGASGWDDLPTDDWAVADARARSDAELYGPSEFAELLGITTTNLYQRKSRGLLPPPDLSISKVPIWTGETIRIWIEWGNG